MEKMLMVEGSPFTAQIKASEFSYEMAAVHFGCSVLKIVPTTIADDASAFERVQYYKYCFGVAATNPYRTERDSQSQLSHFCADKILYTDEPITYLLKNNTKYLAKKIMYHVTAQFYRCQTWYLRSLFGENYHKWHLVCESYKL